MCKPSDTIISNKNLGTAREIAIGANGSVWKIAKDRAIYQLCGDLWTRSGTQTGLKITVGDSGIPWIVNEKGYIDYLKDG